MPLLTDVQLHQVISANRGIMEGLDTSDWTLEASHIQPSSVDFHIGTIYLPSRVVLRPRQELTLGTVPDGGSRYQGASENATQLG
jgi:hypothetical protein